jgi:double-stranded uracil-DNA glycosylase
VWLVPNPSGLQARYGLEQIAALLRDAALVGRARRLS